MLEGVWRKSSYSGQNGNCVEVTVAAWRKSSYSQGNGACVEVADGFQPIVPVRDSKAPDGAALVFPSEGWTAFISSLKS